MALAVKRSGFGKCAGALADEALFGRLKGSGHVRVIIIVTDDAGNSKLSFDYRGATCELRA